MKNVLLILICTIFGMVSCAPIDKCDYKVVIEYKIKDATVTDTIIIENEYEGGAPSYLLGKDGLKIIFAFDTHAWCHKTIYNGTNPVTVEHFDYTIIRQFKINQFTGKEIH